MDSTSTVTADIPIEELPSWAVWERHLIDLLNDSVHPFVDHFTRDNGEFIWQDEWGGGSSDDYYEPFFSWPLIYIMGAPITCGRWQRSSGRRLPNS